MPPGTADDRIDETLAEHEMAVKRVLDSLGSLENRFVDAATETTGDELDRLEEFGRALEEHVERLEELVKTLDDHKRALGDDSDERADPLGTAVKRARRRAQQEPPPGTLETDEPES